MIKRVLVVLGGLGFGVAMACGDDAPSGGAKSDGSLVLAIASNLEASQMDAVRVEVRDFSPPSTYLARTTEDLTVPAQASLPLAKPVSAKSAEQRRVQIVVSAVKAGNVVVTRSMRTRIPLDRSQMLPVVLDQACATSAIVGCADGSTCIGGACASDDVPLDGLSDYKDGDEKSVVVPNVVHDAGSEPKDSGPARSDAGGTKDGTAILGAPCGIPDERACAGFAQRIALQCKDGVWTKSVECGVSTNCDTHAGDTRGTCQKILDDCNTRTPGTKLCNSDKTAILTCGPDLVNAESAPCSDDGVCEGAACKCKPGFSGDGVTCTSKCSTDNGGCSPLATCEIVPTAADGRTCTCNAGYAGDGITCVDIDECKTSNGGCDANSTCTNTEGSRTCTCKGGYNGDGGVCTDVNECATNNGGCAATATCANTPGGRTCTCKAGYSGDGVTCADVNECATNNGGCSANGKCTNTVGSRSCACNAGYTGDGFTCNPGCGRFLSPVNGWVKDTQGAGLSWLQTPLPADTYNHAFYTICASKGGRLPTQAELLNIADGPTYTDRRAQINTCAFSNWPTSTPANYYQGGDLWSTGPQNTTCGDFARCTTTGPCVNFTNQAFGGQCTISDYLGELSKQFTCVKP